LAQCYYLTDQICLELSLLQLKFLSLTSSQLRHDGYDIDDDLKWSALLDNFGVKKPEQIINQSSVKQQLRENTEQAISSGVFGVPTIMAGTHLFWGFDATDMYLQYLEDPALLDCSKMQAIDRLPQAARRTIP
jgi:2-hydroxychromene-2-carboxylate isomerase